ncbi:hypothetical protein [Carboxylicivirga sp. M1479]|uniref:hypothetical protein n=1 Tax=Carboxylicivirga sp. M1479 TaxID=2594476 RepID=UPI001177523A|nr:hypothetical protein [Carboxylicivirga sp. M1479]TRX72194.1 hypothetical protein FNN09_02145 [Carboxylicivirga sp. M1479]
MKKLFFALAIFSALLASCNDDDDKKTDQDENVLKGDITGLKELDPSVEYTLTGALNIKDGGELVIPAGTMIKAEIGFDKYILVETGGKIMAEGTADKPVTFMSGAASPKAGYWGGIIINGKAKVSGAGASGTNRGSTEIDGNIKYGGDNNADNSGKLMYVKLFHTGAKVDADTEHNGLTLNGVGSGTVIENVYIAEGSDDGVEFFGGSVNVKNLLVVNSQDDMFDITQGWTGTLDNAYGIWEAPFLTDEGDPRGIESDGNLDGKGPDHVDQSDFTLKNISIVVNAPKADDKTFMHDAIKVRRGAKAYITNCLVWNINGEVKDFVDVVDKRGGATDDTVIECTYKGIAYVGNEVTRETSNEAGDGTITSDATVTVSDSNTGADTSAFSWTGYTFPAN